jgi:hypothetical protein
VLTAAGRAARKRSGSPVDAADKAFAAFTQALRKLEGSEAIQKEVDRIHEFLREAAAQQSAKGSAKRSTTPQPLSLPAPESTSVEAGE